MAALVNAAYEVLNLPELDLEPGGPTPLHLLRWRTIQRLYSITHSPYQHMASTLQKAPASVHWLVKVRQQEALQRSNRSETCTCVNGDGGNIDLLRGVDPCCRRSIAFLLGPSFGR